MEIHLYDNWYLTSNNYEFRLATKVISLDQETKEEVIDWRNMRHFGRLDHAVNYAMQQKLRESDATNLKEVKELIEEFKAFIEKELGL